jgi:hypothetical protein
MVLDAPGKPADVPHEPTRLARAIPETPADTATRLPDTAGWYPLLALTGVLALGGGIALTALRHSRKPDLA